MQRNTSNMHQKCAFEQFKMHRKCNSTRDSSFSLRNLNFGAFFSLKLIITCQITFWCIFNCSNAHFWCIFEVFLCTKSVFANQIKHLVLNSFKHFSAPKIVPPRIYIFHIFFMVAYEVVPFLVQKSV